MDVLEDKYKLKDSVIITVDNTQSYFISVDFEKEEEVDLNGQIYGFVKDEEFNPMSNVLVQIMSEDYVPIMDTLTDDDGNYLILNIPPNINYRVYAVSPKRKLEDPVIVNLNELERYELNIILEGGANQDFSVISGRVTDNSSNEPIGEAVVYLYSVDFDNDLVLKSIENTDDNGEFIFWKLYAGSYLIQVNATGYKIKKIYQSIENNNQETDIIISLDAEVEIINGTIYGIIKDSNGVPIPQVDVILYKVNSDNSLTPIKFVKSDDDGVYLFANIIDGVYRVKASKLTLEDV